MRLLFEIDEKNYIPNGKAFVRPSSRAIIIRNNKVLMVHSLMYDYYKFPGGGIENNETNIEALIRETKEEAGLNIIKETIKPYGYVHRVSKSDCGDCDIFIQDNYYYLCSVEDRIESQKLDDYEEYEHFTLEEVDYKTAIDVNINRNHGPKEKTMLLREAKVLEMLHNEGYLK